jgi:predicted RNA-binding Zn ribbon-like protein
MPAMKKRTPAETAYSTGFELKGGHPSLDLVNTLDNRFREDGPVELLGNYADLLRFAQQLKLLSVRHASVLAGAANDGAAGRGAAMRALESVRKLREATAAALYRAVDGRVPTAAVTGTLERYFHDASRHRRLSWNRSTKRSPAPPGAGWVWARSETDLALPVWMLAQAGSELMTSPALDLLRACGSETCRWVFLDTSKNHTRRWCDMKICGNRMKARRFHARRQGDGV